MGAGERRKERTDELRPLTPEPERPDHGTSTAMVPLATTSLRRTDGELPRVCLQLSSSTRGLLSIWMNSRGSSAHSRSRDPPPARTYFKRGRSSRLAGAGRSHQVRRLDRTCLGESYSAWLDRRFRKPSAKKRLSDGSPPVLTWLVPLHPGLVNPADFGPGLDLQSATHAGGICRWRTPRPCSRRSSLIRANPDCNARAMWPWPISC